MKKTLLCTLVVLTTLASCNSENEFHQTSFDKASVTMYADQVKDSVLLYYADDWTASLNDYSWLSVSPTSGKMEKGAMLMSTPLYFTAEPNTSGRIRLVNLTISSHEQGGLTITQLPVLNITYPYYSFIEGDEVSTDNLRYVSTYTAVATEGQVRFTVYRDGATLNSDQAWCVPELTTFDAGEYTVALTLQPNTTASQRTAQLTLTSGGVSTVITINQLADEEN